MEIISDAVLAFLSSAGILFILWTLMGIFFPPERAGISRLVAVYVADGEVPSVEQAGRAVARISNAVRRPVTMVVADGGLTGCARREAELFCFSRGIALVPGSSPLSALLDRVDAS